MATELQSADLYIEAESDTIRVVPIHHPDLATDAAADIGAGQAQPRLTYRNGPLLGSVEVVTIFWGSAWSTSGAALATDINRFYEYILSSPLMEQLSEYSVTGQTIGHGKMIGSVVLTNPAPPRSVTDTAIRRMLQTEIAGNPALPHPTHNSLYVIYTAPGVRVIQGGAASCRSFCGYHDAINGAIFYAVLPYPGCQGCLGGLPVLDALTSTSSHELCEAITDPIPGQGWYDDVHGEIGDICAWRTKTLSRYTVQLEWSNRAGRCL